MIFEDSREVERRLAVEVGVCFKISPLSSETSEEAGKQNLALQRKKSPQIHTNI